MDNVLPLGGDLDEIDLLEEIERAFADEFPRDLRHCHTVGDLHRVLLALIPHAEKGKDGLLGGQSVLCAEPSNQKARSCSRNQAQHRAGEHGAGTLRPSPLASPA